MTVISFGKDDNGAHVVYEREAKICITVINDLESLPDAVALIRTLKADRIFVIAPTGTGLVYGSLSSVKELELYEFDG